MFSSPELTHVDASRLFELAPNAYVIVDRAYRIVGMNAAYLAATMRNRADLIGRNLFQAFPSDPDSPSGKMLRQSFAQVFETGKVDHLPLIPYPIHRPDGTMEERFWSASHTPILGQDGAADFLLQHTTDITELHRLRLFSAEHGLDLPAYVMRRADAVADANAALQRQQDYMLGLFGQAPGFMAVLRGADHVFEMVNQSYQTLVGRDSNWLVGKRVTEALPEISDQGFCEILDHVYESGEPYSAFGAEALLKRSEYGPPEQRFLDFVYQPLRDADGRTSGIFVHGHDVTDQRRAELAARESEQQFRVLAQTLPSHIWTAGVDGRLDWVNDRLLQYTGAEAEQMLGDKWGSVVHPDDLPSAAAGWAKALQDGLPYQVEFRLRRHDGDWRWHIGRAVAVRNDAGEISRWIGANTDIQDQKNVEAELARLNDTLEQRVHARTAELVKTQAVLRQSQKMEAIGNLAGGIAHDFNNLLQVIGGNLQMIEKRIAADESLMPFVREARGGVARAAELASQLLSFSRKQPLDAKVVNIGELAQGISGLLRRSVGDGVEMQINVAPDVGNTRVDRHNFENACLNLAINARDAMDGHGRLTIDVANAYLDGSDPTLEAKAGDYVMIAICDTGCGMPPEVIAQAFEPFFTTKVDGKGTGLGLSMVYGLVKQLGGHITIYSEPGEGTCVRIFLPRTLDPAEAAEIERDAGIVGGSETILVAEDDAAVLRTSSGLLSELGYHVLTARDAQSALDVIESGASIDLLFTDVVMPGALKSADLARIVAERHPHIGVLFTSGFAEGAIVTSGRLEAGVTLLSKPYSRGDLARKIRQVLASRKAQRESKAEPPKKLRVLVCEDEMIILMNTSAMIEDMGWQAIEAETGAKALEALASQPVDALVVDLGLPDMNGVEVARRARAHAPDLPIIFATGAHSVEGGEDMENTSLLPKPYGEAQLRAAIERAVAERLTRQEA